MTEKKMKEILFHALGDQELLLTLNDREIEKVMRFAAEHRVQYIVFKYLKKYCKNTSWFEEQMSQLIVDVFEYKKELSVISDILDRLKEKNIDVMGIKGIETCMYYKEPYDRIMSDIDILVQPEDMDDVTIILKEFGYCPLDNNHSYHIEFKHKEFIEIEVHTGLYNKNKRKRLGNFDKEVWDESSLIHNVFGEMKVMSLEKKIIYLCIHMTNHYIQNSFDLRQLMDLYYVLKSYLIEHDLSSILKYAEPYGLRKFLSAMIYIFWKYFKMPVSDDILSEMDYNETMIDDIVDDIFRVENFEGENRMRQYHKHLSYYSEVNKSHKTFRMLFPRSEDLNEAYEYGKRNTFMLILAWINRLFNIILARDISFKNKIGAFRNSEKYEHIAEFLELKKDSL